MVELCKEPTMPRHNQHSSGTIPSAANTDAPDAIGPSDGGQRPGGKVDGGSASDQMTVNFDDDEIYSCTGNNTRRGGTADAPGGDSGRLGPPAEQLSRSNGPSGRRH
jgi:hypothetical protein